MTLKVGMQHRVLEYYQVCSNGDPGLTLGQIWSLMLLYVKKSNITDFSEIIVVYEIKAGRFIQLNEYMNLNEYQRSRSFIDLRRRSLIFNIFKHFFAQKPLGQLKPIFIWSLHGM